MHMLMSNVVPRCTSVQASSAVKACEARTWLNPSALTRDHEDMSRTAILLNQIDDLRCAMA